MNLDDIIASHARNRATEPAIVQGTRTLTYGGFGAAVLAGAARLAALGVRPGTVVGLGLGDTLEHLVLHFAVARAGAILLPMDHRWTPAEQSDVAQAFGAGLVVVEPGTTPVTGTTSVHFEPGWLATAAAAPVAMPATSDRPLLVSLSSGTTGRPKGAVVTHGQMYERFVNQWVSLGLNVTDRFCSVTPLYFGAGRSFCMSALVAGATVVLAPPPHRAGELAAAINGARATVCFVVPTMLRKLLAEAGGDRLLLPDLRLLVVGGSIVGADEARQVRTRVTPRLASYYAASEGGGISVLYPDEFDDHGDTVGRPVFRVAVEVVDSDDRPVPTGVVGRLRFRGPGVATSFLDDRGQPQPQAGMDGCFYPGDLALIDAGGYVTLQGREKDLIIRGGVNVYPAEVERALGSHPDVRDVAVVAWPSPVLGEEIAAFTVTAGDSDGEALRDWCATRLAPYKVPREVFVVRELPKTAAGKVRKSDLTGQLPPITVHRRPSGTP